MTKTPEYGGEGRPVFPKRTGARRQAAEAQQRGSFRQYAEQYEKEGDRLFPKIDNSSFIQADPNTIYRISGSVRISGDQFPKGVLPANAVPIGKTTFLPKLFLRLGLARRQK